RGPAEEAPLRADRDGGRHARRSAHARLRAARALHRRARRAGLGLPARHAELRAPGRARPDAVRRAAAARGPRSGHLGAVAALARTLSAGTATKPLPFPRAPAPGARVSVRLRSAERRVAEASARMCLQYRK